MRPALLDDLPTQAIRVAFDDGALARGRRYAADRRVLKLEIEERGPERVELYAIVVGTDSYRTDVVVVRERARWVLHADCSCPVGLQCKHGVAVLLYACGLPRPQGAAEAATVPKWEGVLGGLLAGWEEDQQADEPLALQVELGPPSRSRTASPYFPDPGPSLLVRPLRRGTRGTWVKVGATWNDAAGWAAYRSLDRRQASALVDLAALRGPTHVYAPPSHGLELGSFGPGVWSVLGRARAAGVALVAAGGLSEVVLSDAPAQVALDVVRAEEGLRVTAVATLGNATTRWTGDEVLVLGSRAHGLALIGDGDGDGGAAEPDPAVPATDQPGGPRLLLAPLESPLDPGVQQLLRSGGLVVPPDGEPVLLDDYLPRLRRHVTVGSSDGSVRLPAEQPPRPRLTLDWTVPGALGLAWEWRTPLGRHETVTPLGAPGGPGPERSRELLEPVEQVAPGLTARPRCTVDGCELLELVGRVLPLLRDLGEDVVEVVDVGRPVGYRETTGDPVISFEAPPSEPDVLERPTDWLDLQVVLTVDGHDVPVADVLAALTHGMPYVVLPDGLLLPTDHPDLVRLAEAVRAAAEMAERRGGEGEGRVRVGGSDLALWAELSDLGVVDAQAQRWVDAARALSGYEGLPEVEPVGVVSTLRAYQLEGFRWLAFLRDCGLGGILADDMGLGKTLQALAAVSHLRAGGGGPVLVVAPTSVVGTWVQEAARHTPGLVVRCLTASRARRGGRSVVDELEGVDVLVTSYTLLRLEVEQYAGVAWGGLVLDEAQQVKNHRGKTHQAVRCLDADFRLALTGTPIENRLSELWALLSIVAPGLYPDHGRFSEMVASPVEKRGDQVALARFRRRIRPFVLRRTKDLVAADLPPKQEQVVAVTLGARHRRIYEARLQRERQSLLGLLQDYDSNRVAIFAALTRLRLLSLDPALVDPDHEDVGSAKLDELVSRLREIGEEGHRVLVFSQFTGFLGRARRRLEAEGITTAYLDGSTTDRQGVVRDFKEGQAVAFLISIKAGGVGLTLTEADYVVVLDPWWNPAVEAQAVDRVHRIGQTRPVVVYRLVATDTIEEKVMELKERKGALARSVLDDGDVLGQAMTADEVRAMLAG